MITLVFTFKDTLSLVLLAVFTAFYFYKERKAEKEANER